MKILVIGAGGREHALAWKLTDSPRVQKVYVAPGNGGTATEEGVENIALTGIAQLIDFCRRLGVPFGLNVESVSIRREEIEASVDLAARLTTYLRA